MAETGHVVQNMAAWAFEAVEANLGESPQFRQNIDQNLPSVKINVDKLNTNTVRSYGDTKHRWI